MCGSNKESKRENVNSLHSDINRINCNLDIKKSIQIKPLKLN
jgi:hypothetical protein